jgi:two-component system, OmpR family, sensor kinase
MFFHSIRWRLQLWHGLILLLVLAGFGLTAHRLQHLNELRRVDQELEHRVNLLLSEIRQSGPPDRRPPGEGGRPLPMDEPRPPGGPRRGPEGGGPPRRQIFRLAEEHTDLFAGTDSNAFYYVIWRRDGDELSRSSNAPPSITQPKRGEPGQPQRETRTHGEFREAFHFTPPGECVVVGRSLQPEFARLHQMALRLSGLGAIVLGLGLAGGWWLASRAIRPIDDISAAASRIATGDISHRISTGETDNELGQLASVLNSTFSRLEAAFAQQARFTADASHELRTPLSVILSQSQMALARERPAAEYRETLEACQRAAQRMRRLMESLLELARLDAGQEAMKKLPFDLARITGDVVDLLRPLAEERKVTLRSDLAASGCLGDSERLAQVISNLVSNAIYHHRPGGEVHISTSRDEAGVTLIVADNGPGISPDHLPHIFDRFYRADAARTTSQGHTGLGLAISKAIVEAHAGTIEVESSPGAGARFTVRLPAGTGTDSSQESEKPPGGPGANSQQ